ncbi:MAG: phosphoribosylformylglycinamidine synthase subunit PurS [Balneolales bacterium]
MFQANVKITLRKSILDPKGKAIKLALGNLGFNEVAEVRVGKLVQLNINTDNREEAQRIATETSQQLLANQVMEDFEVEVIELEEVK